MQVQCQLFCTQRSYCDFVVWTEKGVYIERIYPDETFCLETVSRVKHFFITSILPELIGKFYSQTSESVSVPQTPCSSNTVSQWPLMFSFIKWAWTFIFSSINWNRWWFNKNILLLSGSGIWRDGGQAVCMNGSTLVVWSWFVNPSLSFGTVQTVENSPNSKERRVRS